MAALPSITQIAAARAKHPDSPPTAAELLYAMAVLMRREGGSLEIGLGVYYDEYGDGERDEYGNLGAYYVGAYPNRVRFYNLEDALRVVLKGYL